MTDYQRHRDSFDGWVNLFDELDPVLKQDLVRHAQLPRDLFSRKSVMITAEEFFRLWDSLAILKSDDPTWPLRMGQAVSVETLSPPMFATVSSDDLNMALRRVSLYKPLVGPVRLTVKKNDDSTYAIFTGVLPDKSLPNNLAVVELSFWVHIARLTTREHIIPKAVYLTQLPPDLAAHERYFGVPITLSDIDALVFSAEDAKKPFLTTNHAIWSILEPELNKRLQDLTHESAFKARVRACLVEMLASGNHSMASVASKLAMSSRTLHRRLKDENTSFQSILDEVREELARHYLAASDYSTDEIAFLLGYEEANSFYRAFRTWTGQTPDTLRVRVS